MALDQEKGALNMKEGPDAKSSTYVGHDNKTSEPNGKLERQEADSNVYNHGVAPMKSDHMSAERTDSLFGTEPAHPRSSKRDTVIASVITGKTVGQMKKGTLQQSYYDGTLIAGAPRQKRALTDKTFDENIIKDQQESYDIAPILGGDTPDDELQPEKFGTWDGVWARCMANIFGVIMFLRTGWVVGQAGIGQSIAIILLSGFITTLTTMSMSAIATNGDVLGGGAYFLISRSVGPSLGGAIGVLFTLGLTLGVALYTIGFCETMVAQLGVAASDGLCLTCYGADDGCCNNCSSVVQAHIDRGWAYDRDAFVQCSGVPIVVAEEVPLIFSFPGVDGYVDNVRIWGVIVNFILLIMILIGIGWVVRLQAIFLALIIIAMLSVVLGGIVGPDSVAHSWNAATGTAPGFVGMLSDNQTCSESATVIVDNGTCTDFTDWSFSFGGTELFCNSTSPLLCSDTTIGSFNGSCVTAIEACCQCNGGTYVGRVETEECSHWVTNLYNNWGPGYTCEGPSSNFYNTAVGDCWDFWSVFAIFFPAVTGIMAGANISNLLQKPEVNLPVGTFHSVAWSTAGYILLAVVVGASATREELISNYFVMEDMELTVFLVPLGVYCATFSSALASLVGGPQLLMAVSADKLIPCLNIFAKTHQRVGFWWSRSRRTGKSEFCFRSVPYVADGLHVYFQRRIKLYLFRHVVGHLADFSNLERSVLAAIDTEKFTDRDILVEHIKSIGTGCARCVNNKMMPAKLKGKLLDALMDVKRLPPNMQRQVNALLFHLDVNLAHYDSDRCSEDEVRHLLPAPAAGDQAPQLTRSINSAHVPAAIVKAVLDEFKTIATANDDSIPSAAESGQIELVVAEDKTSSSESGIHSTTELDGVTFDAAVWERMNTTNCIRVVAGENRYDPFLPIQYGFRLEEGDPVIGYLVVFVIGTGCVLIGTLNVVAPVISMFFLITYGMVNFACALQVWSKNPGWRPAYKFYHWSASLLGAVLCVAAMLIMEWVSSVVAILLTIIIAIAIYASPHEDSVGNWGDATEAAKHMAIRRNLLGLRTSKYHPKNFRPSYLMVFPDHPDNHRNVVRFAYTLRKGFGTTHIGVVNITEDVHQDLFARRNLDNSGFFKMFDRDLRRDQVIDAEVKRRLALIAETEDSVEASLLQSIRDQAEKVEDSKLSCADWLQENRRSRDRMWALTDYVNAPNYRAGACQLMQICGVGPLRPNTLLVELPSYHGLPVDKARQAMEHTFYNIQDALRMRMSVVVLSLNGHDINFYQPQQNPRRKNGCDTWWVMDDGGFSLLIPHLLMQADYWKKVTAACTNSTRYCAVNNNALSSVVDAQNRHSAMLGSYRLNWPMEVLPLERRDDSGRIYTDVEGVAAETIAAYNAIPFAENLDEQDITKDQRQMMLRWLAVAAVMRSESTDAHMVCGTLPFTRK